MYKKVINIRVMTDEISKIRAMCTISSLLLHQFFLLFDCVLLYILCLWTMLSDFKINKMK